MTENVQKRIQDIEAAMLEPDFWNDSQKAQAMIKELQELKDQVEGKGKYDRNDAIITIVAGAGGDDAEDFARMLVEMYQRYAEGRGWSVTVLDSNANDPTLFAYDQCIRHQPEGPNVLILGDSHAAQYYQALTESFPNTMFNA